MAGDEWASEGRKGRMMKEMEKEKEDPGRITR